MSGRKVVYGTGEEHAFVSGQTMCRVVMAGKPPRDMTLDELIYAYGGSAQVKKIPARSGRGKILGYYVDEGRP